MKLKKLYIKQYKNLKDFAIDFESGNGLSILVGNNGSGKSNVLEAISGIFHDLFKEKGGRKIPCDYTLEYALSEVNCKIEQSNGILRCYGPKFKNRDAFVSQNSPNNIIGLYSGEEDRLWATFFETYYKAYISRIKTNRHQERMRLMFINKYYWDIALLTLLLSSNETLRPFINDELRITSVSKITLNFDFRCFDKMNDLLKSFIERINPEHKSIKNYTLDDLRQCIYYNRLLDASGKVLKDADGKIMYVISGITDLEVFQYLTQAYMPKSEKILKGITI